MTQSIPRLTEALAGRYRLERELGAGGMATVYLAHDIRHDRRVAVKVLRPELAAVIGAERFLAEIKLTANLQHPHILPLFDSGEADSFLYYVMPYVEGVTLRDRITKEKQLPVGEAVQIAVEVAAALDYAHRHNVIHRDIKPENILLHDGSALVADFGIALALSTAGGTRMTETGMSLGTPHYMSPEQAMGEREITARSDVYALGAMTYEMLTGEPPFTGPTAQAIVAKVVTDDPRPLTELRRTVPPHVDAAVLTALEKLPADRYASAAAFSAAITGGADGPAPSARVSRQRRGARRAALGRLQLFGGLGLAVIGVVAGYLLGRPAARPAEPVQLPVLMPGDAPYLPNKGSSVTISRDGRRLVYLGTDAKLHVRDFGSLTSRTLMFTEGATGPFLSPDARAVGFYADGALRSVQLEGGPPVQLARMADYRGAVWGDDGQIYVTGLKTPTVNGLFRVPEGGGELELLATPDTTKGVRELRWPALIPGKHQVVVTLTRGPVSQAGLATVDLGDKSVIEFTNGTAPTVLPSGQIIFAREVEANGALFIGRLASDGHSLRGEPVRVLTDLLLKNGGAAEYAVSPAGRLVYFRSESGGHSGRLEVVRDTASVRTLFESPKGIFSFSVAPDGHRIALSLGGSDGVQIAVYDVASRALTQITFQGTSGSPVWSPDGRLLAFTSASTDSAPGRIMVAPADRSLPPRPIRLPPLPGQAHPVPLEFAGDGGRLLIGYTRGDGASVRGFVSLHDEGQWAGGDSVITDRGATFSPDGHLAAFTRLSESYGSLMVKEWPGPGGEWQVTEHGGYRPVWARNGRGLYYETDDGVFEAPVDPARRGAPVGTPFRVLFRPGYVVASTGVGVLADGSVVISGDPATTDGTLITALDWPSTWPAGVR